MDFFTHGEDRLAYTEWGEGDRTVVLLPGLLMSQKMQWPLARALAERGNRVVTLDLLGHGASDRPQDMTRYSMGLFAEQALALLDHLGVEDAVVGGTSLGANVTLELAALAPARLRAMLVEMPVLDNALPACALFFTPLMIGFTFGEPLTRLLAGGVRRVPRTPFPLMGEMILDAASQAPGPSGAILQGLFFGRIAPHRDLRRTLTTPALVIGHPRDPIHPFSDADALAHELPHADLLNADSIVELRAFPERLTGEIGDWVDDCWDDVALGGRATA